MLLEGANSLPATVRSNPLRLIEIRRMIQTGANAESLLHQALHEGMRTLRQDGIEKVLSGITSMEEVRASSNI